MDNILQGLQEIDGVLGALVVDATGQVLLHRAHSVYDFSILQQAAKAIVKAVDSIQLLHDDWEGLTTTFSEGKLLIRNLGPGPSGRAKNNATALAVIADARLNPSFAGVAIRVAVNKLKNATDLSSSALGVSAPGLQMPPQAAAVSASSPHASAAGLPHPAGFPAIAPTIAASSSKAATSEVAASGLSWSGLGGSSTMAASGVAVADQASSAYLTQCTKALARSVGPMAKVFVKDAIRRLWPDRPFSRDLGPALVAELEKHIEDASDLSQFRKSLKSG